MISKAKAIQHGHADLAYIMGESKKKEHSKEKIQFVTSHGLDPLCRSREAWEEMTLACREHKRMSHTVLQMILSPDKKYTKDFTLDDWQQLWEEYAELFDMLDHRDAKGKLISKPTNIRDSLHTVWLHFDSKGGTPHLHAAVCRVDENGNTNPDNNIHLRARAVAEIINRRRGWEQPKDIRKKQTEFIREQCLDILKSMPKYSLEEFHSLLRDLGYEVLTNTDSAGQVRGHSIKHGNYHYKLSEIGRMFTVGRLPQTWAKLHEQDESKTPIKSERPSGQRRSDSVIADYTVKTPGSVHCEIERQGSCHDYYVPRQVFDYFKDEFDGGQISNADDLFSHAVAIFVGLLLPPDVPTSGGGGSSNDKDWGRDPCEDELEWARRCAQLARLFVKPAPRKSRGR